MTQRSENVLKTALGKCFRCDDPPTLSVEFFLFALVFLNRMSVGGAGRAVREMGHTWARVCPRINAPLPHSLGDSLHADTLTDFWHFNGVLFVCGGTFQHVWLSYVNTQPFTYTTDYWLHTPLLIVFTSVNKYILLFFISTLSPFCYELPVRDTVRAYPKWWYTFCCLLGRMNQRELEK